MRLGLLSFMLSLAAAGCTPAVDGGGESADTADLTQVPQTITVKTCNCANGGFDNNAGKCWDRKTGTIYGDCDYTTATYDVEGQYLPRVVQCENPGAPAESLKAQAIAARTWLTATTGGQANPHVADNETAQVFTCSANQRGQYVPGTVMAAVQATRGQIVLYNGKVTGGFFVAGAKQDSDCQPTTDPTNTQHFVTVNAGLSGSAVHGRNGAPSTDSNRGCMGQLQANCLAGHQGLSGAQLLAYFYGADIDIRGVGTPPPVPQPEPSSTPVDPSSTDPSTVPPTSSDPPPTDMPPAMSTQTCSMDQATSTCWSYTLQCWTPAGVCVQSAADQKWYQCVDMEGWVGKVDPVTMQGVLGPCTVSVPLSTTP
jgi:hypothetical protein